MSYYNQAYFDRQRAIGEFGGRANLFKFTPYITPGDVVLDFGCGGGYLLNNLNCKRKFGIDISPVARREAQKNKIDVFPSLKSFRSRHPRVDKIISNSALEHVDSPLAEIIAMRQALKPRGKVIAVVPHESFGSGYSSHDPNHHLFTWTEQTLGNLFSRAGFQIKQITVIAHKWPPYYQFLARLLPEDWFNLLCQAYALLSRDRQILIVAQNPAV